MLYIYIQWPESQDLMGEDWFREEAILDNSENAPSSSYLIPIERMIQFTSDKDKNNLILDNVKELSKYIIGDLDEEALVNNEPWLGVDMTNEEHLICIRDNDNN